MPAVLIVIVLVVAALVAFRTLARRGAFEVRDASGRRVGPAGPGLGRILPIAVVVLAAIVLIPASVRVVPVGRALVVFNTVTGSSGSPRACVRCRWSADGGVRPAASSTRVSAAQAKGRQARRTSRLVDGRPVVGIDSRSGTISTRRDRHPSKIGPDYEERILRPAVRSVIRLVISEYAVMDVYSSRRADIQDEINVKVKSLVEKDGFVIDEVVLRDVRFTDEFAKAIEAKQIAQQAAEQMKYTLEKEQKEAERKVIEASGRARDRDDQRGAAPEPELHPLPCVDKLGQDPVIVSVEVIWT
jgi:hypothetical protein